jgi:mannose-6-phosphate isomerase
MELYPIKFEPILKDKIWGGSKLKNILNKNTQSDKTGESWELSGVEGDESIVSNGFLAENSLPEIIEIYMADIVGEKNYKTFGLEFPLLFKYIDADDVLSIQVHPDDELSKERHNAYGKTEMWYILDADKGADIITGFKQEMNKELYLEKFNSGQLQSVLNVEKAQKGDVFYIPAGRVHAIGKGILLAEIQQTSDVTYRIYDWDRVDEKGNGRELHTDLAIDAFDYKHYDTYKTEYLSQDNKAVNLEDCKYFTTNLIDLKQTIETDYSFLDSFIVYMCVEGSAKISLDNGTEETIALGETVLIPAIAEKVQLVPETDTKLLEVFIKPENL